MEAQQTVSAAIDFSPLESVVTPEDIKAFKASRPKAPGMPVGLHVSIVILVAMVVFSVFIGSFISSGGRASTVPSFVPFLWVGSFIAFLAVLHIASRRRMSTLVRLERFAAANNMLLRSDVKSPSFAGMIFDEGHTRELKEGLVMPDGTELGNYQYVTGSGKNRSTHSYGFIKIPLARSLPHMVLDARSNNLFGALSNLPDTFSADQTLSLEGDFDKYFTLYAPKQYERDALYVFTPDVMAKLIDEGSKYDMEVIGKELYVYTSVRLNLTDRATLQSLFTIISTIAEELRDQTEHYADERVGDRSANIIAPQGARLKRGVNYIVLGIIVSFVALQFVGTIWPEAGAVAMGIISISVWGLIIFGIVKKVRG